MNGRSATRRWTGTERAVDRQLARAVRELVPALEACPGLTWADVVAVSRSVGWVRRVGVLDELSLRRAWNQAWAILADR